MKDFSALMQQAQAFQERLAAMRRELEAMEICGEAGAGLVRVTMNGEGAVTAVHLDPSLVTPDGIVMLQDLITAAVNDARVKAAAVAQEKVTALTGGLSLPGGVQTPI